MKFLIDENLPPKLAAWLREHGHDAVHVGQGLGFGRRDQDVADAARTNNRVLITKDGDFENPPNGVRVLHLRVGNSSAAELLSWFEPQLERAVHDLATVYYVALD